MSATISQPSAPVHVAVPAAWSAWRFGAEAAAGAEGPSVQWLFKRNCSITPLQTIVSYASLCLLSLAIGGFFWIQGAALVMPFATLEVVAVGAALLLFARHATDRETIRLRSGRLTVEQVSGRQVAHAEFASDWVRVASGRGGGALIEISGQGRRIAVGRFVRPELRRQLADELHWAVRRWRSGGAQPAAAPAAADHDNTEH